MGLNQRNVSNPCDRAAAEPALFPCQALFNPDASLIFMHRKDIVSSICDKCFYKF